jgi:hypothetical protein
MRKTPMKEIGPAMKIGLNRTYATSRHWSLGRTSLANGPTDLALQGQALTALGVAAFLTGYGQVRAPLGPMRNERTIRSGESGEQDIGRSSADYETWRLNSELANARPQGLYLATALRPTRFRRADQRSG